MRYRYNIAVFGILLLLIISFSVVWIRFNQEQWGDVDCASEILAMNASRFKRLDIVKQLEDDSHTQRTKRNISAYKLFCIYSINRDKFEKLKSQTEYNEDILNFELLRLEIMNSKTSDSFLSILRKIKNLTNRALQFELYVEMAKKFVDFNEFDDAYRCLSFIKFDSDDWSTNIDSRVLLDEVLLYLKMKDKNSFIKRFKAISYSRRKVIFAISLCQNPLAVEYFKDMIGGRDLSYKKTIDPMLVSDERIAQFAVDFYNAINSNRKEHLIKSYGYLSSYTLKLNLYVKRFNRNSFPIISYVASFIPDGNLSKKYVELSISNEQLYEIRNGIIEYALVVSILSDKMGNADKSIYVISKIYPLWKRAQVLRMSMRELSNDGKYLDQCLKAINEIRHTNRIFDLGI